MHETQSFDLDSTLQTLTSDYSSLNYAKMPAVQSQKGTQEQIKDFQNNMQAKTSHYSNSTACQQYVSLLNSEDSVQQFLIASCSFQISELLAQIPYDQILIEEVGHKLQDYLKLIFQNYQASKISFTFPVSINKTAMLATWLHSALQQKNVVLSLQVQQPTNGELLQFASAWINSLPSNQKNKASQAKIFGYPFPIQQKKTNYLGRKEQISLKMRERQILTARQFGEEGKFFIINGQHHIQYLEELLVILFTNQKGLSLEIGPLEGGQLVSLAQFAVNKFRIGYRLVIGHQLELTPCRMVLNTVDLNEGQVERMMRIGAQSGRYEIALYSQICYFKLALNLFLGKPFIKFNFFLPIQEWNPETQQLIVQIEDQCRITKKNVFSYSALLKRYANLGYVFVNELFHTLALEY